VIEARPIGEIIAPIMEKCRRLAGLQFCLSALPRSVAKQTIMSLKEFGGVDADEAEILIQSHMLEDA